MIGYLDIFVDSVDKKHCKAWFEFDHWGLHMSNSDVREKFGFMLCEALFGDGACPKTPDELMAMLYSTGWHRRAYERKPDKFKNVTHGPYTIKKYYILSKHEPTWDSGYPQFYRAILNSKTGEWTVIAADDEVREKTLVERWRYSKTDEFKRAEEEKRAREQKQREALKKLTEDTQEFFNSEAKKRGISLDEMCPCCCGFNIWNDMRSYE